MSAAGSRKQIWLRGWDRFVSQMIADGTDSRLVSTRQLLVMAVALEMRDDGTRALASMEYLMRRTTLPERTAARTLAWALSGDLDGGWLFRTEKGNRYRKASVYEALLPATYAGEWQVKNGLHLPLTPGSTRQTRAQVSDPTPPRGGAQRQPGFWPRPADVDVDTALEVNLCPDHPDFGSKVGQCHLCRKPSESRQQVPA